MTCLARAGAGLHCDLVLLLPVGLPTWPAICHTPASPPRAPCRLGRRDTSTHSRCFARPMFSGPSRAACAQAHRCGEAPLPRPSACLRRSSTRLLCTHTTAATGRCWCARAPSSVERRRQKHVCFHALNLFDKFSSRKQVPFCAFHHALEMAPCSTSFVRW